MDKHVDQAGGKQTHQDLLRNDLLVSLWQPSHYRMALTQNTDLVNTSTRDLDQEKAA